MTERIRLRVLQVTKLFPGVIALDKIDFAVQRFFRVWCGKGKSQKRIEEFR
jgi:ABC-type sugar transport system ATPase subunit